MGKFTVHTPGLVYLEANKSFSGDHKGMWYRFKCMGETLSACVWPMPFCFDKTDDALKTSAEFPFDADGLAAAEQWVCQQYEQDPKRWAQNPFLPIAPPVCEAEENESAPVSDDGGAQQPVLSDDDAPPFDL